ncbi:hypothetical protein [Pseudomonas sp. NPDC090208]|uniref:hypothetical protein n=1 Tax=Pseudomonas sp. NPDC090208 TaxID=3364478 RepID=UPI00381403EA
MTVAIVNNDSGEVLHVMLELGRDLWVRDGRGHTEKARVEHFPLERWTFEGAGAAVDDLPVHVPQPQRQPFADRSEAA